MNNPVAKHSRINRAATHRDRKKDARRAGPRKMKHKGGSE